MDFSTRLSQILFLLLNSNTPIPAETLGNHLRISKRTIFRELEHVDKQLGEYQLSLKTTSKKGICLEGENEGKELLLTLLRRSEYIDPKNIEDRKKRLILTLLKQAEPQKIYAFSILLQVSEGTVNHDLDSVEQWFSKNDLQLIRKPGLGVYLSYEEENYRKACMRYIHQNMAQPYEALYDLIEPEIVDKIISSIRQLKHEKLRQMAEISYMGLIIYLSIITKRVLLGKNILIQKNISIEAANNDNYKLANTIIATLSQQFAVDFPISEVASLYIYIKGVRLQSLSDIDAVERYPDLQCMVYDLIHLYDPTIAYSLKNDDALVKGLIAHLDSAIVRLQNRIEIPNPFQGEIMSLYPDIYTKTKCAVKVLEESFNCTVPDAEIGLLALHFGGASVRLKNNTKLRHKVRLGVVCTSGIGISTLLSSRLSNIFHDKVKVTTLSFSDLNSKKMKMIDLLLSTLELPEPANDYLRVHPMLTEQDVLAISDQVDLLSQQEQSAYNDVDFDILYQVDELRLVSNEISSILNSFNLYFADADISFETLVRMVSRLLGSDGEKEGYIFDHLTKREALSTQVIPEFELVFLHTKTKGVEESKFILIRPETGQFLGQYFCGSKLVVVMLIPENDPRQTLAISGISSAIFDDTLFLCDLKDGNIKSIRQHVEKILKQHLTKCINNLK